jgi:hypothetical protein
MPDVKCSTCGETSWLLNKKETRSYYAVVKPDEMRWVEMTKKKHTTPFELICAKCEESADTVASMAYQIRQKPLRIVWQNAFFEKGYLLKNVRCNGKKRRNLEKLLRSGLKKISNGKPFHIA